MTTFAPPALRARLLFAHRGASAELPENTMPAFRRAIEAGANAIETDAHLTRDGRVVLAHDPTGLRIAGIDRAIAASSLDEIRAWDAGEALVANDGSRPFARQGFRTATLDELLAEIPDVPVNVDAKHIEVVPALLDCIRRARAEGRVIVASFDDRTIRLVRSLGYGGVTALARSEAARLVFLPPWCHRIAPLGGGAAQIPDRVRGLDLGTARIVARCHALGLLVHYWTIDDQARARALLAVGADGVMTNDPAAIAPAFRQWQAPAL